MAHTGADESVKCKICSSDARVLYTTSDDSHPAPVTHCRCPECGLVFVANRFAPEELAAAYAKIDPGTYYSEIATPTSAKFAAASRNLAAILGDKNKEILDIGAGDGGFIHQLLADGFRHLSAHEIPGTDLEDLAQRAVRIYHDFDFSILPSTAFDAITLLDVAEHVPDPVHLFRSCFRCLKPGGILYFHTPCVTPFDRLMHQCARVPGMRHIGRVWQRGRTSIYHLQNYTPAALNLALGQAGFADLKIERKNELSWPVKRYVRIYLCEKQGFPPALAHIITPLVAPMIATDVMNPNKGIVTARRPAA